MYCQVFEIPSMNYTKKIEWIIDQYRIKGDSDPNRKDDPGYIVRLVGQVIRVSVETVTIVNSLPDFRAEQPAKRLPATRETAARKPLKNVIG